MLTISSSEEIKQETEELDPDFCIFIQHSLYLALITPRMSYVAEIPKSSFPPLVAQYEMLETFLPASAIYCKRRRYNSLLYHHQCSISALQIVRRTMQVELALAMPWLIRPRSRLSQLVFLALSNPFPANNRSSWTPLQRVVHILYVLRHPVCCRGESLNTMRQGYQLRR